RHRGAGGQGARLVVDRYLDHGLHHRETGTISARHEGDNGGRRWYGNDSPRITMQSTRGRPTVAEVSLGALRNNLREAQRLVGDAVRVMAVVKADGYGHGAAASARAFLDAGAGVLGTSSVAEAVELRAAGITAPIVVLG